MTGKKSKYLDYFEIYKEKATCKTCGAVISCVGRSTSAMKYHMEHKHQDKIGDSSPPVKKLKVDSSSSPSIEKFVKIKKPSLEEIVAREAAKGASFEYLATSPAFKRCVTSWGYKPVKSHNTIRKLLHKSAEKHRKIYRDKIQVLKNEKQRFCTIADEWTCPSKKRKYLNVILHVKGKKQSYYLPDNVS